MPQTVIRDPTPDWLKEPITPSPVDQAHRGDNAIPWEEILRRALVAIGADDPTSQIVGLLNPTTGPVKRALTEKPLKSEGAMAPVQTDTTKRVVTAEPGQAAAPNKPKRTGSAYSRRMGDEEKERLVDTILDRMEYNGMMLQDAIDATLKGRPDYQWERLRLKRHIGGSYDVPEWAWED